MIVYYRDIESGDFLAIDTDSNAYYRQVLGRDHFEGRATAIANLITSTCTTGISRQYLQEKCRRVPEVKVPVEWMNAIGLEDEEKEP